MPELYQETWAGKNWMDLLDSTSPAIKLMETEDKYRVELIAHGAQKEDFQLKIDEDNNLVIRMESSSEEENGMDKEEKLRYLRRNYSFSRFQQKIELPEKVIKERITAKMEDGVLKVLLPKTRPEDLMNKEKRIEIL